MKKIALLTLLLINLSLSFSLPRNQASPAIFSVTKTNNSILFRHTDSTLTAIPCQSVASIVSNADPSKIVSVWVVQQGDYDKIMQFDYSVCGFSSKSDAVDSLTAWAICDTSSGGGGGSQTLSISNDSLTISGGNTVVLPVYVQADSSTISSYEVLNSQNAPPGSPSTGDVYLVGTSPTGAWVGHAKDIVEWNGSSWDFTDGVQGDFLYNATNALTYIFRSGNWVQTTGIPALNNGNTISSGLTIGTNNARSLTFETNNVNRGRFDSVGRFHIYNLPTSSTSDTFVTKSDLSGKLTKVGQSTFLSGVGVGDVSQSALEDSIDRIQTSINTKQNTLVSGTNIKTINSTTLLGSGNLPINVGVVYRTDSIRLYIIGSTDTIVFGYAVRGLTYASDTLSWYVGNTRTANYIGGGGGGGSSFITKTKAEIDALISTNALVKGATYKITGVHPTLYDDGTTSGTTIILKAISENVLETQGTGIFYNPKYNQSVDGFGIWENKMYGTLTSIVGQFDYINKEGVTANNGATGLMLAEGMIQWVSGNWSVATSIEGDVSGATASISGFVSPAYSVSQKVIWGGYSWTNVNGNVGTSTDVLNLDSEWSKDVYDTTNYNVAYDVIEYDYVNDMIIRRYEASSNVDVRFNKVTADLFFNDYGFLFSAISVQQFGNAFDYSTSMGILNKLIDNGYDESINFCGAYQQNLKFGSSAAQFNLTFGSGANQQNLTFGSGAGQANLTFGSGAYQYNLTFGSSAYQGNLTFGSGARQTNLTFGSGAFQTNLTFESGAAVYFNNQTLSSQITNTTFNGQFTMPDISAATHIYDATLIKDVYARPDGALKIRYYDNSDALVIADIAD